MGREIHDLTHQAALTTGRRSPFCRSQGLSPRLFLSKHVFAYDTDTRHWLVLYHLFFVYSFVSIPLHVSASHFVQYAISQSFLPSLCPAKSTAGGCCLCHVRRMAKWLALLLQAHTEQGGCRLCFLTTTMEGIKDLLASIHCSRPSRQSCRFHARLLRGRHHRRRHRSKRDLPGGWTA